MADTTQTVLLQLIVEFFAGPVSGDLTPRVAIATSAGNF